MRALARRRLLGGLAVCAALPSVMAQALPQLQPVELAHARSFELVSRHTGQRYRILLGLPHGPAPAAGYPVLYALDGHASFPLMEPSRPRPAGASASPMRRERLARMAPGLIVAVGYASGEPVDVDARALDYTPPGDCRPDATPCDQLSPRHGGADRFQDFLAEELMPLIARLYPVDPTRLSLFGHSYGGLFTLYTLLRRPELFSRYWASSPSLWFDERGLLRRLPQLLSAVAVGTVPTGLRVHLGVGMEEQFPTVPLPEARLLHLRERRMVDNAKDFVLQLRTAGWPRLRLDLEVLPAHDHGAMMMQGAGAVLDFAFGV